MPQSFQIVSFAVRQNGKGQRNFANLLLSSGKLLFCLRWRAVLSRELLVKEPCFSVLE